ncbi:protein ALP1-like [Tripterygium wilfordii]|uniref:protein ALP1-like n=1 Tax=Tripterygium wilfordii TaxID=458696 RepID=UPI0018F81A50|nr:protein ALP1-like [Tripterygium wilfordii]
MGSTRRLRKRRKTEIKVEENGLGKEEYVDWWFEFSKRINGIPSSSNGFDSFESLFKFSRRTFDYICSLVKADMLAKKAHLTFTDGQPLSLPDQVAVALRRLSSGDSLAAVGDSLGLNHSTVAQVTWRFVVAMQEKGHWHLQWPSTEAKMTEIKSNFEKKLGLPNCCGVIDTTHILMSLSTLDPASEKWLDHEKNHSMLLQAIVDHSMRFLDIVTGWPGQLEEWAVFESSGFCKLCNEGERLNGKKLELSEGLEIGEYLIGDAAYRLLPFLVTPYQKGKLPVLKAELNKRLSAAQMAAQMALAKLKEMWRIIGSVLWRPDKNKLPRIIHVCCILHNIIIDMEDEMQYERPLFYDHDPGYRQQICQRVDTKDVDLRDNLSLCCFGEFQPQQIIKSD